jgi:hypothetical protein
MKALRWMLPVLLLATPAYAQDVTYNFDSTADFSKYKTYRWEQHPQSADIDQITLRKLGAAFDAELARKGLAKTESANADMVIVYQAAVRSEKEINSYSTGWATGGAGWGGGAFGSSQTNYIVSTISIGSLNLDMYDASRKQLVWRGIASKTLDPKAKPEKQDKNIAKAAQKMLKNYPPPKKK